MAEENAATRVQTMKRFALIGLGVLVILFGLIYFIVAQSWSIVTTTTSNTSLQCVLTNLTDGTVVEQQISKNGTQLSEITLYPSIPQAVQGTLTLDVLDSDQVVASASFTLDSLKNMNGFSASFDNIDVGGTGDLLLRITVSRAENDSFFSLYYWNTIDTGRYQIPASGLDQLTVNGKSVEGRLSCTLSMMRPTNALTIYLIVAVAVIILYIALMAWTLRCCKVGRHNILLVLYEECKRYRYLIERLVSRDFNTKYRQSILGVLWSFLNPLLTMLVYYIVFSTIFKSDIPNFPVYLLTGIVMFNFFSEASSMCLESITCNASLITKVYVPKYIYPLSRVMSSLVNLVISLIPLLIVTLITGVQLNWSLLLLPIPIICEAVFSLGMGMILATSNVFFRDTKFLWSVLIMMWNFLTPVFYPESIIPSQLTTLYHMNPLYQFVYFVRCILLDSVTPQPITYIYCIACAVIPLMLGLYVFRKYQNRFVLYL
jgi:ABC-2 type transport system permease protein